MRSGVRAPGDAGVGNLGLQQKWRFLKKGAPQNHRFQYSDGLMMSNDLDDLEVPTVPPILGHIHMGNSTAKLRK